MTLDVTVRVNDVLFRTRESVVDNGDGFYIDDEGFEGWDDGADVLRDALGRPQAHGSFDVPGFLDSRVVSLTGSCWASTPERLVWFRSRLTGLLAGGESGQIVVEQPGETLWANGRLAGKTTFAVRAEDIRSASFQIQFWCANPRKFGTSRTFASGVAAYHMGNFPASPVFTITGARAGYTIPGPSGKSYIVTRAIVGAEVHTVDMADGFLRVNGVIVSGGVSQADTWAVPGGAQITHTLSGLTTTVRDTFI